MPLFILKIAEGGSAHADGRLRVCCDCSWIWFVELMWHIAVMWIYRLDEKQELSTSIFSGYLSPLMDPALQRLAWSVFRSHNMQGDQTWLEFFSVDFFVIIFSSLSMHLHLIRVRFYCFNTIPSNWPGRMSMKCWMRCKNSNSAEYLRCRVCFTVSTTLLQPFYGPLHFVRDYPGKPVPER